MHICPKCKVNTITIADRIICRECRHSIKAVIHA